MGTQAINSWTDLVELAAMAYSLQWSAREALGSVASLQEVDKPASRVGQLLALDKAEIDGRPLQATGVHERMMELLMNVGTPKVHSTVTPTKLMQCIKLGQPVAAGEPPRLLVKAGGVVNAFYEFLEPPRILSAGVLKKAVANGVSDSQVAWCNGPTPQLEADNLVQVSREKLFFGRTLSEDEVDFDSGWLIVPVALPGAPAAAQAPLEAQEQAGGVPAVTGSQSGVRPGGGPATNAQTGGQGDSEPKAASFKFKATRDQIFKAFPAIANLADKSDGGQIGVHVEGTSQAGFDSSWLRNAVNEPLQEANVLE